MRTLGFFQLHAECFKLVDQDGEIVVQVARAPGNLDGIVVAVFHAPQVGDRAQCRQQGARADQRNPALQCIVVESGVGTHGFDEGRFDGHEQQHEIQRAHAGYVAVVLAGKSIDVAPQREQMLAQRGLALGFVLLRHGTLPGDQ